MFPTTRETKKKQRHFARIFEGGSIEREEGTKGVIQGQGDWRSVNFGRGYQGKWTKRVPATIHANSLRAVKAKMSREKGRWKIDHHFVVVGSVVGHRELQCRVITKMMM